MEIITDLLNENPDFKRGRQVESLQIREDPQTGIFVHGLSQRAVTSLQEVLALIKEGVRNRMTSATTMVRGLSKAALTFIFLQNRTSSRSHALLQILIEQRWYESLDGVSGKKASSDNYFRSTPI